MGFVVRLVVGFIVGFIVGFVVGIVKLGESDGAALVERLSDGFIDGSFVGDTFELLITTIAVETETTIRRRIPTTIMIIFFLQLFIDSLQNNLNERCHEHRHPHVVRPPDPADAVCGFSLILE